MSRETKWEFTSNIGEVERALDRAMKKSLAAVGLYVESMAKVKSPVGQYDDGRVGGNLRDSISHKVGENSVAIGTDVEYALYVEKGTYKMRAQPYLTPAAEENIETIKTLIKQGYEDEL